MQFVRLILMESRWHFSSCVIIIFRYSVNVEDNEIRENAAITVVKHLNYFFRENAVSTPQKPVSVIQYLAAKNKNNHLDAGVPNLQEWEIIKIYLTTIQHKSCNIQLIKIHLMIHVQFAKCS